MGGEVFQPKVIGVILAAGGSSRLGRPKQLLERNGLTLIERLVGEMARLRLPATGVILGSHRAEIRACLKDSPVKILINADWRNGLSGSIRRAVRWARTVRPQPTGLLLTAVDQVLVEHSGLGRLLERFEEDAERIVVARYAGTCGIPAIFGASFLDALGGLSGDRGARALLKRYAGSVHEVDLEEAALDIDRPADWEAFLDSDTMSS